MLMCHAMKAQDRVILTVAIVIALILAMMVTPALPNQSHRRHATHAKAVNIVYSVSYPVPANTPSSIP